jgi:hypothetical protein
MPVHSLSLSLKLGGPYSILFYMAQSLAAFKDIICMSFLVVYLHQIDGSK